MIEATDKAIQKLIEKDVEFVRLGVTGGGCAGYEYLFRSETLPNTSDEVIDYGKFSFIIDPVSKPYLEGMKLDWVQEGLNEFFKFLNPNEESSCGCGVSVQFRKL